MALGTSRHFLVKPSRSVGQSAAIHLLRDCEVADGLSQTAVLDRLLADALGRVLVFHNAALDLAYLDRATSQAYGAPLLLPTVDTMMLEHTVP